MTTNALLLRSLRHHWRAHLGAVLGATLATGILVGALAVGDSVRFSLRSLALSRVGKIELALTGRERFFRQQLAVELARELKAPVTPVIVLNGTVAGGADNLRVPRVQVVGADHSFWRQAPRPVTLAESLEQATINRRLANQLGLQPGEEILIRVDKPSLLSRDAPLSTVEDASVALRLPVGRVVADDEFGRFSLEANQISPFTVFVPLPTLQQRLAQRDRINTLLIGSTGPAQPSVTAATGALTRHWQLADAGLELREVRGNPRELSSASPRSHPHPDPLPPAGEGDEVHGGKLKLVSNLKSRPMQNQFELRTDRVFLDPPAGEAALKSIPGARGVLTYFVNELRVGTRSTPYSTVAALVDPMSQLVQSSRGQELRDGEIIINSWLSNDLWAYAGDEISLTYYIVDPLRKLEERTSKFRIRAIVGIDGATADADLMPAIPGLSDKKNCRDWEPGVPIKLERLRDRDQEYWSRWRGTPKAFITLAAGQRLWNNRFGDLTAVRTLSEGQSREAVEMCLKQALSPAMTGLYFTPIRAQALAAAGQGMNFGLLFLGFSLFLIAAALLLTALLFALGVEQRSEEVGLLLALGFTPRQVQRFLLREGGGLALMAMVLGAGLGTLYTRAVIAGLAGIWRGAVAGAALQFHAELFTLGLGALASFLIALLSIGMVVRRQARVPARELLYGGADSEAQLLAAAPRTNRRPGALTAVLAGGGGIAMIGYALTIGRQHATETFFVAGTLLLLGGLGMCRWLLHQLEGREPADPPPLVASHLSSVAALGQRNVVRRRARSLSVVALLACGTFMVIAVGASRHDPGLHAHRRDSGTGGFALFAESSLPVHHDLNASEGREHFGLEAEAMRDVSIVPLRVREGDEASCRNLNRAQTPRLLGVNPELLARRGAFASAATWKLLTERDPSGAVPALGDQNTVLWSLQKFPGQALDYRDERGREFQLKLVGLLPNSVVQGSLLISEANFLERFPSQSGYQTFLMDAPAGRRREVARTLTRALEEVGLEVTPAVERLANFLEVEHTYLSIFAVLGGLGLLLGSAGLGVVVLRNVLDRRGELGLLRAVGFTRRALQWLVFSEHLLLMTMGLSVGMVAAGIAVLPSVLRPGNEAPVASLASTLFAVMISGVLCTAAATALALRGPLMSALRND